MRDLEMKKYYIKIIVVMLSIIPIIDTINGYCIQIVNKNSIVGPVYRILLITLFLFILIKEKLLFEFIKTNYILIYFYLIAFVYFFVNGQNLLKNIIYSTKLVLPIIIFISLKLLNEKGLFKINNLERIFYNFSILYPVTIIIPLIFNIGLSAYSNKVGYKGLYKSNNELSIILVSLLIYCLFNNKNKYKFIYLIGLFNLFCLLLIGSKTSILAVIIIFTVYIVIFIKNNKYKYKSKYIKIALFIFSILCVSVGMIFNKVFTKIVLRQMYFIKHQNLLDYLLSARNKYVFNSIQLYLNSDNKIFHLLFGFGPTGIKTMEMDFFDLLFFYGIIGTVIIAAYYIQLFNYIVKNIKQLSISYVLSLLLILLYSLLAGHIMFGAMAGSMLGLVIAGIFIEKNSLNKYY